MLVCASFYSRPLKEEHCCNYIILLQVINQVLVVDKGHKIAKFKVTLNV